MDNFLMGATRAQVDGVGRIVGSFVQQMNASLSDQLLTLGRTMTEVNQHQQASLEQVRQSLNAAAAIQVDMRQLHDVTNDVRTLSSTSRNSVPPAAATRASSVPLLICSPAWEKSAISS